jgi:hypothetical protein
MMATCADSRRLHPSANARNPFSRVSVAVFDAMHHVVRLAGGKSAAATRRACDGGDRESIAAEKF